MAQRNATLDYARLVAAAGIVLFHTGAPLAWVGYAALPFFTMLLIALAVQAAGSQTFPRFARDRALRLLRPWLIWSTVYGVLKLAEVGMTDRPMASEFAPWMLLTGPAIHLWFLPFAFVACLAAYPAARLFRQEGLGQTIVLITLGALTAAATLLQQGHALLVPVQQWVFALPAAIFGLAFGFAEASGDKLVIGQVTCLALAISVLGWSMGWVSGLVQFAIASSAMTLCLLVQMADGRLSRLAAALSLNVYLAHPLIASLLERSGTITPRTTTFAMATIIGALAFALVLHMGGQNRQRAPNS